MRRGCLLEKVLVSPLVDWARLRTSYSHVASSAVAATVVLIILLMIFCLLILHWGNAVYVETEQYWWSSRSYLTTQYSRVLFSYMLCLLIYFIFLHILFLLYDDDTHWWLVGLVRILYNYYKNCDSLITGFDYKLPMVIVQEKKMHVLLFS